MIERVNSYKKNNHTSNDIGSWEASVVYEVKVYQEKFHSVNGSLQILHPKSEEIVHHFDNGTYKFSTLMSGTELYGRVIIPDGFTLCDLSMSLDEDENHIGDSGITSIPNFGSWSITSGKNYQILDNQRREALRKRQTGIERPSGINVLVKEVQIPSYLRKEIKNAKDSFMNHLFGDYLLDE